MRDYELVVIFGSEQVPDLNSAHIDAVTSRISAHGGEVNSVNSWGKRKFAHMIRNQREGHYVLVRFAMDPARVGLLEESLRLTEDVTRFLVVRQDVPEPSVVEEAEAAR